MRNFNIPIFVPHKGCPYDCVFCNQRRITGIVKEVVPSDVDFIINNFLRTIPKDDRYVEVAFFGGSFTGIPIEEQSALLEAVRKYKNQIDGIRLSTRPDYINKEILDNLLKYGVTTIELGVQSMDDNVLKLSNRGHTSRQVVEAVNLIKEYPFRLGLQMMTGLPGDTPKSSLYTADEIIKLNPQMVRIYPTLIIKDTYLEKMYTEGRYIPQNLDEAVELSKQLILKFEKYGIDVIRVGLQSTEEINEKGSVVAGPVHSSFRELVEGSIYYDLIKEKIKDKTGTVVIYVNDREISKAIGNRRINIKKAKLEYNVDLKIKGISSLKKREVTFTCC